MLLLFWLLMDIYFFRPELYQSFDLRGKQISWKTHEDSHIVQIKCRNLSWTYFGALDGSIKWISKCELVTPWNIKALSVRILTLLCFVTPILNNVLFVFPLVHTLPWILVHHLQWSMQLLLYTAFLAMTARAK